jgi:trimeric autotransporter adhesin
MSASFAKSKTAGKGSTAAGSDQQTFAETQIVLAPEVGVSAWRAERRRQALPLLLTTALIGFSAAPAFADSCVTGITAAATNVPVYSGTVSLYNLNVNEVVPLDVSGVYYLGLQTPVPTPTFVTMPDASTASNVSVLSSISPTSDATASATSSLGCGPGSSATGNNAVAVGSSNSVTGANSGAFGTGQTVNGTGSFGIGDPNTINGNNTFVTGNNNTINGNGSFVYGNTNNVNTVTNAGAGTSGWGDNINVVGSSNTLASTASANGSAVLGNSDTVNATNAIAIGNSITVSGTDAIGIGQGANATGNGAAAVGQGASANQLVATAFGQFATANGSASTALGANAQADGDNSIAIGGNTSGGAGNGAFANGSAAIALGNGAQADGTNAIAIGNGAVSAANSVVTGPGATDNGFINASVYGADAQVGAAGNVAVGNAANASSTNAVAVGQGATVLATNGTAIGQGAVVQSGATNSVAIGQGSIATTPNSVSFGTPSNPRVLSNVAPGVLPTDAVNVSQLDSVATGVQSQITGLQSQVNRADSGVAMAMAMGGGFLPDNKKFALGMNYGTFSGESGFALTGLYRLTGNVVVSGSAGYGMGPDASQFGGRAGVQFAW